MGKKPQPNQICPLCDSGKKYKKCCGAAARQQSISDALHEAQGIFARQRAQGVPDFSSLQQMGRNPDHVDKVKQAIEEGRLDAHAMNDLIISSSEAGNIGVVELLIEAAADVNVAEARSGGVTPLHLSCQGGHTAVVMKLIAANADVHQTEAHGSTPLNIAAQTCHVDIAKLLLDNQADINHAGEEGQLSPLWVASMRGSAEMTRLLIDAKADVDQADEDGFSPVFASSQEGHVEVVKMLLNANADPNQAAPDRTAPLHLCCKLGRADVVKVLIDGKADVNSIGSNGLRPLYVAARCNQDEVLHVLINAKADPNITATMEKHTPLHILSEDGQLGMVEALVEANADVNRQDTRGAAPLHLSIMRGKLKVAEVLLEANADVNMAMDFEGLSVTALNLSANCGIIPMVRLLIKHGAVDTQNTMPDGQIVTRLEEYRNVQHNPELKALLSRRRCGGCGGLFDKGGVKPCGGCKLISYCSRECQKKDWKEHKKVCKTVAAPGQKAQSRQ